MEVDCGSARDRLGRTLGGKYHLREVLGAGGTAVVYRATVGSTGDTVAVKVLHDHLSRSEEVCRRFVREGQLGNVLDHPNTVRVLDHGATEEQCPYLVLEFLEGESLEDRRVRAGGRLDMWETLDFCDQLLAVLEAAHAKNIVHRDIKPSNLFVTNGGVLKVLDFGIARLTDDTSATATKTGQMVGTPAFMPPEQALSRPKEIDARTDIWSVGATLFTLLSGEHVHIAETSSEHLVKAATLHARSLARALPGVPSNVEALVARCLAFDKNERWASATSMRAELSFVRDDPGRRIGTSTSPPPERVPSDPNMPTIMGSMRAHQEAATISSIADNNKPSNPYASPPVSERETERTSETDLSLVSNPGAYDLAGVPRRRWLLPFAIASTIMLMVMSGLALMLAVRTPSRSEPSVAASAAPPPTAAEPPPQPIPTPSLEIPEPPVIVAAAAAAPAAPAPTPKPAPTAAVAPVNKPATTTPSTPILNVRKSPGSPPPPAPTSRKDVYRPF